MTDTTENHPTCGSYVTDLRLLIEELGNGFANGGKYDAGKTAQLVRDVVSSARAEDIKNVDELREISRLFGRLREHRYFKSNAMDTPEVSVSAALNDAIDDIGVNIATAAGSNKFPTLPGGKGGAHNARG